MTEQPKKKSSFLKIALIVIAVLIIGAVVYEKGQEDMRQNVRQERAREEMEKQRQKNIADLKDVIPHKKAELQMAYDELNGINSFHLLRSEEDKEAQLAAQNKKIDAIKEELDKLQNQLVNLENTSY